jgi:hypothetical protein
MRWAILDAEESADLPREKEAGIEVLIDGLAIDAVELAIASDRDPRIRPVRHGFDSSTNARKAVSASSKLVCVLCTVMLSSIVFAVSMRESNA